MTLSLQVSFSYHFVFPEEPKESHLSHQLEMAIQTSWETLRGEVVEPSPITPRLIRFVFSMLCFSLNRRGWIVSCQIRQRSETKTQPYSLPLHSGVQEGGSLGRSTSGSSQLVCWQLVQDLPTRPSTLLQLTEMTEAVEGHITTEVIILLFPALSQHFQHGECVRDLEGGLWAGGRDWGNLLGGEQVWDLEGLGGQGASAHLNLCIVFLWIPFHVTSLGRKRTEEVVQSRWAPDELQGCYHETKGQIQQKSNREGDMLMTIIDAASWHPGALFWAKIHFIFLVTSILFREL